MIQIKRIIYSVVIFMCFQCILHAQDDNTFIHTIQPGETVYSIARTYQVTPDELLKLNRGAEKGIKSGNKLMIPQHTPTFEGQGYHTISQGETLYGITHKYQVSASSVCDLNPGLNANNFKVGTVIKIPKKNIEIQEEKTEIQVRPRGIANSGCMEMYRVGRRETLHSIANQFGVTEEEIKAANIEMNDKGYQLRKGTFICIPFPKQQPRTTEIKRIIPSDHELFPQQVKIKKQQHITMGVILPFNGNKREKTRMVEFYRGILMAADSIKHQGISIDIHTFESGTTKEDIASLIDLLPKKDFDLIIGPLHQEQIPVLGSYCQKKKIRLVVPFSSQSDELYQNPYYYAVNAPTSFMVSEASKLAMTLFCNDNIIVWDSYENDVDACLFTDSIQQIKAKSGTNIKTIHMGADTLQWLSVLELDKNNVVIPNSSNLKALNQLLPEIKLFADLHPEYKITLLGYPEWQTYTNNHLEEFYRFNTYAYSSFYRNPLSITCQTFETAYQKEFAELTINSFPQFGMFGFDIAYYFLKGISLYSDGIEQYHSANISHPYQHWFNFQRISNWSGFVNKGVQLIHYSPNYNIELIRLK